MPPSEQVLAIVPALRQGRRAVHDQISALHKMRRAPTRTLRSTGWRVCSTAAAIRLLAATDAGWRSRTSASLIRARRRWRSKSGTHDRLGFARKAISALAQLAIYSASTAKSNAAYIMSHERPSSDVTNTVARRTCRCTCATANKLMKRTGSGYQYDHDKCRGSGVECWTRPPWMPWANAATEAGREPA